MKFTVKAPENSEAFTIFITLYLLSSYWFDFQITLTGLAIQAFKSSNFKVPSASSFFILS